MISSESKPRPVLLHTYLTFHGTAKSCPANHDPFFHRITEDSTLCIHASYVKLPNLREFQAFL